MKDVLSVENMRKSDAYTISQGTSGTELMMRAARGIFENVSWKGPVGIVCGSGNNAGDGYALASIFFDEKIDCDIIIMKERFTSDAKYYYDMCVSKGVNIIVWNDDLNLNRYRMIVDCILGTGFSGKLREDAADVIEAINASKAYIVSADINSGLGGDNGMCDLCVRSDITVAIGGYKPGHFLNMAKDVMAKRINCDIGIKPLESPYRLIEDCDMKDALGVRANYSNKSAYGYVALIGGSKRYSGAIRLAYMGNAAMRSGAGVVKLAVADSLYETVAANVLESTIFPMPDNDGEIIFDEKKTDELVSNVKTVAFGMGIGVTEETELLLLHLLDSYDGKLIVDADGLTILSRIEPEKIRNTKSKLILTPHMKEFSRLTGLSIKEILNDPIGEAKKYAKEFECILLLKGPSTIVTDGETVYITDAGCAGMATAGSGDVLSGVLSAVCSYVEDTLLATVTGAHIAGRAGEMAGEKLSQISMIASDTVSFIPQVLISFS